MKLDGQNFTLKPGCVIGFYLEEKYIVIMPESGKGIRLKWQNDDDKRIAPGCVRTEKDFREVVELIAATMGLRAERDNFERSYGPAYLLTE